MIYSDLHTHTNESDGEHTPEELMRFAKDTGLDYIAVTDHDNCNGIDNARKEAERLGINVITGIEFATAEDRHQHILGYAFDKDSPPMKNICDTLIKSRDERKYRIIDYLKDYGFDISLDEVEAKAGGIVISRPHFAQVMVDKGYVESVPEAFKKYLDTDEYMKIERYKATAEESIRVIIESGGHAVLAHPIQLKYDDEKLFNHLKKLKEYGLFGLECHYSTHSPNDVKKYLEMAKKLDLLPTGGSDFHGEHPKPNIHLTRYTTDIEALTKNCYQEIKL